MHFKVAASVLALALATVAVADGTLDNPPKNDTSKPDISDPDTKEYLFEHRNSTSQAKTFSELTLKPNTCYPATPVTLHNNPTDQEEFEYLCGQVVRAIPTGNVTKCEFYKDKTCDTQGVAKREISNRNMTDYNFLACERVKPTPTPKPTTTTVKPTTTTVKPTTTTVKPTTTTVKPATTTLKPATTTLKPATTTTTKPSTTPTSEQWIDVEVGSCRSDIKIYSEPKGYLIESLNIHEDAKICYLASHDLEHGTCNTFTDKTLTQKYPRNHVFTDEEMKTAYVQCRA
ncbi:hypothetical protein BGZ67_008314 [Mortierella alpina]|nr:hypothetical protein BGZ67_008314 [Mortierella alpina]